MDKWLTQRNTIIVVGVLTLWRLYLSAALQLHPDEAYYWLWSRHLDASYYDHPPMVAYFIWLTTRLSNTELWVRLSGTIVSLIVSGLIWRLALQLFKSIPVAAGSVMLFNAYPLTVLGLMVITPDVPVFLFFSSSIYLFWQAVRSGRTWLWYALGVSFGLALLSKYTAILIVPCIFIYLVLTDDRRCLKTIHPYLSLLLGWLCFLPVLWWNSRHDWVSFEFQLRNGLGSAAGSLDKVAEYIGGQLLLTGPMAWLLGMYAAVLGLLRRDRETLLLSLTALPIIAFFGLTSLRTLAGPNWPAFAYVTLSILVARYCLDSPSRIRRALWAIAVLASVSLSAIVTLHARFNVLPIAAYSGALASADATNWFYGWRELGAELTKDPGRKFVVTPSHQLSAEIIYYTDASVLAQTDRGARPSEFNLWHWPTDLQDREALYVWVEGDAVGDYTPYLSSTTATRPLTVYRDARALRTYHMVSGARTDGAPASRPRAAAARGIRWTGGPG